MQVTVKPLNQELRKKLQRWLDDGAHVTARNVIRCKIALEKEKIVANSIKAVDDDQFAKDAAEAAREVVFYERVLTLLASMQLGHKPGDPDTAFEYPVLELITDQEPLNT